jgi:hypothetical protein
MLHVIGQVLFLRLRPPYWRHRLDCDHDGDGTGSSEHEPPPSGDSKAGSGPLLGVFFPEKLRFLACVRTIIAAPFTPLHGWKYAMAQQTTVRFVDDIDGSEAVGTVSFSLNNRSYEIDLSDANTDKLHDALAPFVEHARQISGVDRAAVAVSDSWRRRSPPARTARTPTRSASGHGSTDTR